MNTREECLKNKDSNPQNTLNVALFTECSQSVIPEAAKRISGIQ